MSTRGMLYVSMQPHQGLSLDRFNEWYNNEHGPLRLRLSHMFANGLRFRAVDNAEPHFVAAYDVPDMAFFTRPEYTPLRMERSPREVEIMAQIDVRRHLLDLVAERSSPQFQPVVDEGDRPPGMVLLSVQLRLRFGVDDAEHEVGRWCDEEHIATVSQVPGWLRSRRFRVSHVEEADVTSVWVLHEFSPANGLDRPEETLMTKENAVLEHKLAQMPTCRRHELFYVFGPAPRDMDSLSRLSATAVFTSPDGRTKTMPGSAAVIESYATATDGMEMAYRLEGNASPNAPTVAFCNSLLTSQAMWDETVALLVSHRPELRVLRFDPRGRHSAPPNDRPASLDDLADDLAALLDALRIRSLHALIGVSLGGATAVRFALRHPGRLLRFVACDFNAASSQVNTAAWKERIGVAESDGMAMLARATVDRWFHPRTLAEKPDLVSSMTAMVAANHVRGFALSCQALWDYDLRGELPACRVPGLLVVGEGDANGALVTAMRAFADLVGDKGADLKVIPLAGHLPMFERPVDFWAAIQGFL